MMADQSRPTNARKARRGGISVTMGYRLLQKQSNAPRISNRVETAVHVGHGEAINNLTRDTPKEWTPSEVSTVSDLEAAEFKDDISADEFNEDEASQLLNRFLTSHSRPNSSDSLPGPITNDQWPSNPRKRPASVMSKDESVRSNSQPPSLPVDLKGPSNGMPLPLHAKTSSNETGEFQDRQTACSRKTPSPAGSQSPEPRSLGVPSHTNVNGLSPHAQYHGQSEPSQISRPSNMQDLELSHKWGTVNGCSGDAPTNTDPKVTQQMDPESQIGLPSPRRAKFAGMKPKMRGNRGRSSPSLSPPPMASTRRDRSLRRSTRSRGGPSNYYDTPPGFRGHGRDDDDDDDDDDAVQPAVKPLKDEAKSAPQAVYQSQRRRGRLVYQSDRVRIIQGSLSVIDGDLDGRIPYCPFETRHNLATYCATRDTKQIKPGDLLHISFTVSEINALCNVMGCPCEDDDTAAPVLITKLVRKHCVEREQVAELAKKIRMSCSLTEILAPCQRDLSLLLIDFRSGDLSGCSSIGEDDIKKVQRYLSILLGFDGDNKTGNGRLSSRFKKLLAAVDEGRLHLLAEQCKQASLLQGRNRKDVRQFLFDAWDGLMPLSPVVLRATTVEPDKQHIQYEPHESDDFDVSSVMFRSGNPASILRRREFGHGAHQRAAPIRQGLLDTRKFELDKSWHGASNDVIVLSWSPDGTRFAAGAAAQSDEQNMQYNRNNNLLLGDLTSNKLKELPDHRISRPSGYAGADPNLYMSVTAMKWRGKRLFTASYDQTVKVWDVTRHSDAACVQTLRHPGKVQVMSVSDDDSQLIATGAEVDNSPFMVWRTSDDGYDNSSCLETIGRKDAALIPTSLSWGTTPYAKDLLVAGMSGRDSERGDPAKNGYLALWKVAEGKAVPQTVSAYSLNIFDITWHPISPAFATASSVPQSARIKGVRKDMHSLVRVYDTSQSGRTSRIVVQEFECPALDINDITFCPFNSNYVTASCTDGSTYVWDHRNPNNILHRLQHGPPIQELDSSLTREQADFGIRLALWGNGASQFYTGSSDGHLKSWNILAATENALTENVASFGQGIMSGVFSPDRNNLLLGDACGGVHVLSNAPWSKSQDGDTTMDFEPAQSDDDMMEAWFSGEREAETQETKPCTGRQEAHEMLRSGQLVLHPEFGAGQGPNYRQYYAAWARPPGTADLANTPLNPDVQAEQLSGPPVHRRKGLDKAGREKVERFIQLALARNKQPDQRQVERKAISSLNGHNHPPPAPRRPPTPDNVIDLTLDDTDEEEMVDKQECKPRLEPGKIVYDLTHSQTCSSRQSARSTPESSFYSCEDPEDHDHGGSSAASSCGSLDEDHWWPINVDPNLE